MKESKKAQTKNKQKSNTIPIRWLSPKELEEMDKEMKEWVAESKKRGGKFYGED